MRTVFVSPLPRASRFRATFRPAAMVILVSLVLPLLDAAETQPVARAPQTASVPASALSLAGQRVLVLGDSITQDGRYVSFLEYYLHTPAAIAAVPAVPADLISIGLSSETVSGLSEKTHPFPRPCVLERLDRALAAVKPTVVIACYGMNDGIYHPPSPERLAAFESGLRQLIAAVRATGAKLILITPPVFDPLPIHAKLAAPDATDFGYSHPFPDYDQVLAEFARVEVSLHEPDVTVIDLHTAMSASLAAHRSSDPAFSFTKDGVHPGDEGHALIAATLLHALGLSAPAVAPDRHDPLFALVDDRRRLRSEAWLPFIGYIRGEHFKSPSVDAAEKAAARLADEIALGKLTVGLPTPQNSP